MHVIIVPTKMGALCVSSLSFVRKTAVSLPDDAWRVKRIGRCERTVTHWVLRDDLGAADRLLDEKPVVKSCAVSILDFGCTKKQNARSLR
jgi:hypothetical protein